MYDRIQRNPHDILASMNTHPSLQETIAAIISGTIRYPETRNQKRAAAVWLLITFLAGVLAWGYFFSWGKINLEFHDWSNITAPRLQFLKDAAIHLELPLHISNPKTLNNITDRYLSVPDAFISPQAIFLRWLDVGSFVFYDTLLMYALGFLGLLLIARRFRFSVAAFSLLFLLFNFNGHILAHYSVGHATWGGYFLFPFFVLLVFDLLDGRHGWGWVAKTSVLMLAIFLQGSFHQFVWLLIFLLLIAVCIPKFFKMGLLAAFCSVMISLFRILPPALLVNQFDNKFISGYPTIAMLWSALTMVMKPGDITVSSGMTEPVGLWEFSLYVGLVGALFLIGFGLYRWLFIGRSAIDRRLLIPLMALTVLSMGNVYKLVSLLPVPLFTGERVSSRMISVVFVFLAVIAAIELQRWIDSTPRDAWFAGATYLGTVLIAQDLWENLKVWQVNRAYELFPNRTFTPAEFFVKNNYGDGGYLALIALGAVLSTATFLALGYLAWRESRRKDTLPSNAI